MAICLVLFSHTWMWLGLGTDRLARVLHYPGIGVHIARSGRAGVGVFFCLSGFLITRRLIDDGLKLRQFYVRRAFRILPAAFLYLTLVAALGACGVLPVSSREVVASLLFYRNSLDRNAWFTGHFWSLSIEEQFYLAWPIVLAVSGIRLSRAIGVSIILAIVVWRHANWPLEGLAYFHTDMRLDAILCGSVMALSWSGVSRAVARVPAVVFPAVAICFFVVDLWNDKLSGAADFIQAILVCFLLAGTVSLPGCLVSRLFERPLLQGIGRMSYSIYLWQQLFLHPNAAPHWQLPLRLTGIAIFAGASYYLVERRLNAAGHGLLNSTPHQIPIPNPPGKAGNPIAARISGHLARDLFRKFRYFREGAAKHDLREHWAVFRGPKRQGRNLPPPHRDTAACSYLWIIDLPFRSRFVSGGLLRYFNFSRELLAQGHKVTFAAVIEDDREPALKWMESLRTEDAFSDFCELTVDAPAWNRGATLLLPLGLHGLAVAEFRALASQAIDVLRKRYTADVVLVSSDRFIYFAPISNGCARIGDFCDSCTLFFWRDVKAILRRRRFVEAARRSASLLISFFREIYVCRKYDANIFASPVDKRVFDVLSRQPERNRLLSNGVRFEAAPLVSAKVPGQLIFSGTMSFPPNYDSALWFLDCVFPLVLKTHPEAVFVIAGGNPTAALLARAATNVKITGFVPDMNLAIAQSALCVAPMRSGSGFKNKVVEAIASGTWVIGTTLAVEFFGSPLRDLITVRDDPAEMAGEISSFLDDPAAWTARLEEARRILFEQFSWAARASELNRIVQSVLPVGEQKRNAKPETLTPAMRYT